MKNEPKKKNHDRPRLFLVNPGNRRSLDKLIVPSHGGDFENELFDRLLHCVDTAPLLACKKSLQRDSVEIQRI